VVDHLDLVAEVAQPQAQQQQRHRRGLVGEQRAPGTPVGADEAQLGGHDLVGGEGRAQQLVDLGRPWVTAMRPALATASSPASSPARYRPTSSTSHLARQACSC
jgi:hypothetical protein